ncbi:MAG: 16S rRNA (guanine(966)-N(2))-methyltransferase RsmD [Candidatus Saccharibacteria bacterium]|nr:16S rRNA (guanine(966)-N(2))-methyltransferase RsmD [Candidatus Saccharibacteria bacterium]
MRITSGKLKGRQFDAPGGHKTHPMSERLKTALFNVLGDIEGLNVLDAFAGSGALGFEALSRGAHSALLLDSDRRAAATIRKNIETLGLSEQCKVTQAPVPAWSERNQEQRFNLIFADPPFNDVQGPSLAVLAGHLLPTGLLVVNYPKGQEPAELSELPLLKQTTHAGAQLLFYKP